MRAIAAGRKDFWRSSRDIADAKATFFEICRRNPVQLNTIWEQGLFSYLKKVLDVQLRIHGNTFRHAFQHSILALIAET